MLLELDVDDAGRVRAARVLESAGADFDESALAAARDFVFEPAREGERAVAARVRYRYAFRLTRDRAVDEDAPRAPVEAPSAGEAVVRSRAPSREVFSRELVAEDLRRMPGTRGDALLAVQNLPGVGRPPFGLGAFVLRGSDPEDTLVTLESQPFGTAFHLYGLATTIATDLLERVELLPGNFSARYGRVAGGVVNVTLRAPPRDRPRVSADVDLVDAGVSASIPLGRRASVAAGIRRSYLDAVLAIASPDAGGTSFTHLPRYWDWQLVLDADLSPRDAVRVVGAGSDDALVLHFANPDPNDPSLRGDAGSETAWHGVQARWRHRFGADVNHTLSLSGWTSSSVVTAGVDVRYEIDTRALSLRDEVEARLSRGVKLFAGVDLVAGATDAAVRAPPLSTTGITDPAGATGTVRFADSYGYVNPAGFVEAELSPWRALRVLAGVRVDHFSRFDATRVDPRGALVARLHDRVDLRAGVGSYSAPPRGYYVLPGFGNPSLQPERWLHATAGFRMELIPGALELTGDAFYKRGYETVAPSRAVVERAGVREAERFANTGSAEVIGAEFLLRLRPGRVPLLAWLSYTHQRAQRRDGPALPWYESPWDQPHLLTAVIGAILPYGWELGLRARWTSGLPEPRVLGALYDADHDVSLTRVAPYDPARLPDFFSLDVRAAKRFRWGPVAMQVILEVLNATNQANVESRVYSYDRRTSVPVTGLPILPVLGLRGEY